MSAEHFPRQLNDAERRLLRWLLPAQSPGYDARFRLLDQLLVIGQGRWGDGNLILGQEDDVIDLSGPMEPVFAYGVVREDEMSCTVVVHEEDDAQVELQFALTNAASLERIVDSENRYSYSYWMPGDTAPASDTPVRIVSLTSDGSFVMVIAPRDERIWIHDKASKVNHLIPHTKFHTELMRHTGSREKAKVFNPKLLFTEHNDYDDSALRTAFITYNNIWKKLVLPQSIREEQSKNPGLFKKLFKRH
jgi:hypothetical protein